MSLTVFLPALCRAGSPVAAKAVTPPSSVPSLAAVTPALLSPAASFQAVQAVPHGIALPRPVAVQADAARLAEETQARPIGRAIALTERIVAASGGVASAEADALYDGRAASREAAEVGAAERAPAAGPDAAGAPAFDFRSLNPTSRYFLGLRPAGIKRLKGGRAIEMTLAAGGHGKPYLVRWEEGRGVEVLRGDDGLQEAAQPALRGIREMLDGKLADKKIRDPLYARMLEYIQAELSAGYRPGSADPLWRRIWAFTYRDVNPTTASYASYRVDAISASRGEIKMVARSTGSSGRLVLAWARSRFTLDQDAGIGFTPNRSELRGMQLILMQTMLETGSRDPRLLKLLDKLQDAVTAQAE